MADDKKPQPFPLGKPPPPNRPAGTIILEPGEELPGETTPLTSPPGGRQPPPKKPGTTVTAPVAPGPEARLYGGPEDGKITTLKEAQEYFQKGYGYRDLATDRLVTAKPQPQPQPTPTPTVGIKTKLAQSIETLPTPEKPEIISPYSKEDQKIIGEIRGFIKEQPPGPGRNYLEEKESEYIKQAKKNVEEKNGPVPIENLPIIKKMVGEFKDFYYQGYAKVVEKAKERAGEQAWNAEYGQKQAIQYGMSSLTDLHRGLDLASWNFFFKLLGPLGSILENYHRQKIGWDMSYYGRAWWSPYRIDYLIKTLPEEKAFDLVYETFRNTVVYYVNKIAGSPIFSKTATYDRFGRKLTKDFIVFTPLLKMQKGVNIVGTLADNISQRNTYAISLAFQKYQEDKKKFPKNSPEFKKAKDDWITFKNDNGDKIRNKLARFLGLRSVARNIRQTHRDPLSFLAILLGEWLFDITVGNFFRATLGAVTERLAASKFGVALQEFFSGKYMTAGKMLGGGLVEAGKAVFSVNTLGGGLIGYQIGGVPGAILGSGGGWFWQTVRNFGLNEARMGWTQRYLEFLKDEKYFGGKYTTREFVLGPKLELQPTWAKFFDFKWNITGRTIYPFRWMLTPGPISRFANWLNTGTLQAGALKIPIGQLIKPLPNIFINGTLIRFYVSPFLSQLGIQLGWDPAFINFLNSGVFQYGFPAFWEYRPLLGNLWGNVWQRLLFTDQSLSMSVGEKIYHVSYVGGGPGVGFVYERVGGFEHIRYVAYEEGGVYRLVQPRGFYRNILEFRSGVWQTYQRVVAQPLYRSVQAFLEAHKTTAQILNKTGQYLGNLRTVGFTNLAGFIIGWEIASLMGINPLLGGAIGWFAANPILTGAGMLLERFGLFPTGGSVAFVGLFNTGFWLGAGFQFVAGFFGFNLPFWFPIASGLTFALAPSILIGFGFLLQPIALGVGNALVMVGTLATGTIGALATFSVVVGITSVAALAIFSIIIIGSAFWIPLQEQLAGITAVSPCFDISSPNFTDGGLPIFKNGDTREVCWTTTNKEDFYQDAISKEKTFDPPESFTVNKYTITINMPGQSSIVVEGNKQGSFNQGGFTINAEPSTGVGGTPAEPKTVNNGYKFKITPPKDTGGLYKTQVASQISQIVTDFKNGTLPEEFIDNNYVFPQIFSEVQRDYILQKELEALQNMGDDPKNIQPLKNAIDGFSYPKTTVADRINTFCPGNTPACQFQLSCTRAQDDKLKARCKEYLDKITKDYTLDFKNKISSDFSPIITAGQISAKDRLERINQLKETINSINKGRDMARQGINLITDINNKGIAKKTGAELQTAIDALATEYAQKYPQNYLPSGSTITICLTLKYNGEDNKVATLTEKDAAILPVIGPLSVPGCQAQITTLINAAGPGNLQWPTDKRELSGGYNNTHKGVDIKGTPGKPIKSSSSGIIVGQGYEQNGFGYYRIIQGDDGFYYIYAHLGQNGFGPNSAFTGKGVGEKIQAGEEVGYLGSSGNVTGPHLHFAVSTKPEVSSFYNNSNTTLNPCTFFAGGCP